LTDIQPNVVLTADTSQYDQAMSSSADITQGLAGTIDTLTQKLDKLTKSAGRKLVGIAAADVAAITAATAAYAAYEKQMSQLQAQSVTLDRSTARSKATMETYERSVKNLRATFGTTTAEAAQLTQQLSKIADRTTPIAKLSETFVKMSNATGESSIALAQSVLGLQRAMGTPQRDTQRYADQLTTLASGANTTATALGDFASQLAPLGRMVGMSQTDITGVATAFTKAGQDGFQASTAFSKMVSDIAQATQTGSPDLAKYANLVGVTVEQFKQLSGTEQIVKTFDSLNKMGPRAITELNNLGLDGMRTMRAITAMSQQSGGIGAAIQQSRAAFGNGSVERGSAAAMKGVTDEFAKLRSELNLTAEAFGATFAPALNKVMQLVEGLTSGFRTLMDGPFGTFVKGIAAVVAPTTALAGGLLLMAGTLAKVAAAATVLRGAPGRGFMEGLRGGSPIVVDRNSPTGFGPMAGGTLGRTGQQIAANGSLIQRFGYNGFAAMGGATGAAYGFMDRRFGGPPGSGSVAGRVAAMPINAAAWATRNVGGAIYSPLSWRGISDPTQRMRLFTAPTLGTSALGQMIMGPPGPNAPVGLQAQQRAYMQANPATMTQRMSPFTRTPTNLAQAAQAAYGRNIQAQFTSNLAAGATGAAGSAAAQAQASRMAQAFSRVTNIFTSNSGPLSRSMANMIGAMGGVMGGMASAGMGGAKWGTSMMGRALASPLGASLIPMAGIMGVMGGGMFLHNRYADKTEAEFSDLSGSGNAYRQAAGLSNNPIWQPSLDDERTVTMQGAKHIGRDDVLAATRESHKLTNTGLYGLSEDEATAYLATQWDTYKNDATARQEVVLDLIDKFDAETADAIISRLDIGTEAGVSSFFGPDFAGLSKGEAGEKINLAVGATEDLASSAFVIGGTPAAQRTRTEQKAATLQGFLNSVDSQNMTSAVDDSFGILEDKLFGGKTNFTKEGILALTNEGTTTSGGMTAWTQNEVGKLLATGDMSDPETAAKALSGLFENAINADVEGIESGITAFLGDVGVQNASDIDVADQEAVNKALLEVLTADDMGASSDPQSLQNRLRRQGDVGSMVVEDTALDRASRKTENINAQYKAIDSLYEKVSNSNKDMLTSYTELGNVQGEIGDVTNHSYQIIDALRGRMEQDAAYASSLMDRPQAYQQQVDILGAKLGDDSKLNAADKDAAKENFIQATLEQAKFFQSMLLQQQQFDLSKERANEDFETSRDRMEVQYNLSRQRAQDDFHLARKHQEFDYQLMRTRAEESFERAQTRGTQSYNRSMRRAHRDFTLSRKRQEADYLHSVEQMVKQAAQTMYNAYERVRTERTSSAGFLAVNLEDQVARMQEQSKNLDRVREMGLSDEAIQNLGLGNADKAQQLERLVSELANDPMKIGEINAAIAQQMTAAEDLVTDESSNDWAEFQRGYELSRDRAMEDFRKSVRDSRKDFRIQMDQMEEDFRRSMREQADDYERAQTRQQEQFSKSMTRSAEDYATAVDNMVTDFGKSMDRAQEDLDLLNTTVSGTLLEILTSAASTLTGETGRQADAVLQTFKTLDTELGAEGVKIMKRMADIFGFEYTPPAGNKGKKGGKKGGGTNTGETATTGSHTTTGPDAVPTRRAEGGVLPGHSVGRDNMHYFSPEHGQLSLSGGEAIMVPEWVDQIGGPAVVDRMNNAARYKRGFWQGGVLPLPGATSISKHPASEYPNAAWSGDLNWPGRTDYGKPIVAYQSGIARPFDYGSDTSYGRGVVVEGGSTNSLYAHMSAIVKGIAGEMVQAGQTIGFVGDYGNTGDIPTSHLHFEIVNGGGWNLPWVGNKSGSTQAAPAGGTEGVLQERYPAVEEAAANVTLGGGLFEDGFWSKRLNQWARQTMRKWNRGEEGEEGAAPPPPPENYNPDHSGNTSNQDIVRAAMRQHGWHQWPALHELVMRESGFDNTAQNPTSTAYGMFQFLDSTWAGVNGTKTSDPTLQAEYGMRYIRNRYGSPKAALDFHNDNNWYGDGSIFTSPQQVNLGERGPEAVIPLNSQGVEFMQALFARSSAGAEARGVNVRQSTPSAINQTHNYQIDRSTNFHGAITVQSSNPGEFIAQMRARQRVMALSQASLGGARL
jgi:TP901 family phage tail tape measure protein